MAVAEGTPELHDTPAGRAARGKAARAKAPRSSQSALERCAQPDLSIARVDTVGSHGIEDPKGSVAWSPARRSVRDARRLRRAPQPDDLR
jgi:hypothetical protein